MRITKLIKKRENALILNQILSTILKRNVLRSVWRICMWILGLKGLTISMNLLILQDCTVSVDQRSDVHGEFLKSEYHIVYSDSYSVPVLYFTACRHGLYFG